MSDDETMQFGEPIPMEVSGVKFQAELGYDATNTPLLRLSSADNAGGVSGMLRLSGGVLEVFKRGFKLCSIAVSSTFGIQGRLQSDSLQPTAGRDSLSAQSHQFVQNVVHTLEVAVANAILKESE